MDKLSLIQDFRKLEKELGKETSDLILKILDKREEILFNKLATKEDLAKFQLATREDIANLREEFANLRVEFANLREDFAKFEARIEAKIGGMAWKMAMLLILQAGVIVALIKLT